MWKTWGRTFQAGGPAKAKAQVCTSSGVRRTDRRAVRLQLGELGEWEQMPSERQVEADRVGIVSVMRVGPA